MTNNKEKLKKEILEEFEKKVYFSKQTLEGVEKEFYFGHIFQVVIDGEEWYCYPTEKQKEKLFQALDHTIDRVQKETLKEVIEIFDNLWGSYDPSKSKLGFDGQFKKKLKEL